MKPGSNSPRRLHLTVGREKHQQIDGATPERPAPGSARIDLSLGWYALQRGLGVYRHQQPSVTPRGTDTGKMVAQNDGSISVILRRNRSNESSQHANKYNVLIWNSVLLLHHIFNTTWYMRHMTIGCYLPGTIWPRSLSIHQSSHLIGDISSERMCTGR